MKYAAKAFNLSSPEGQKDYEDLVNQCCVTVTGKTDGLTKEGEAIRVLDYRQKDGVEPPYKPPI